MHTAVLKEINSTCECFSREVILEEFEAYFELNQSVLKIKMAKTITIMIQISFNAFFMSIYYLLLLAVFFFHPGPLTT